MRPLDPSPAALTAASQAAQRIDRTGGPGQRTDDFGELGVWRFGHVDRVAIADDKVARHEEAIGLAELARDENINGLIISNTTLARDGMAGSTYADEAGGVSGAPLFDAATDMLRAVYRAVCQPNDGKLTLIGVGGVSSAAEAYAKIRAGASLVQLYTGLVYEGPGLVTRMKRDLAARLRADGFAHIEEAIGSDVKETK